MSSITNTAPKYSWRERQAQKAEEADRKKYANTENNFPTLVTTAHRINAETPQGYASMANDWREQQELAKQLEAYRTAKTARERRTILNSVYIFRKRGALAEDDDEEDFEEVDTTNLVGEEFPPHGPRGTYSEVYGDGWRLVVRRQRKQKRELTNAELAQKYRDEFFETAEDGDDDVNGDLTDRNQRREFY